MRCKKMLTEDEIEQRRKGIGGSDAKMILDGKWLELYEQKVLGIDPVFSVDQQFLMDLGHAVEPVIRERFLDEMMVDHEHIIGEENVGMVHPELKYMACNLDTNLTIDGVSSIQEIKYHTGMKDIEELAEYYYGQIQHNTFVACVNECHFTVGFGAWGKYASIVVNRDMEFLDHYLGLCEQFWWHVENEKPPTEIDVGEAPVIPAFTVIEDMTGSNSWANAATDWIENQAAAKAFEQSKKDLKELLGPETAVAYGSGVQAKRAKNGAVRISELSDKDLAKYAKQKEKAA